MILKKNKRIFVFIHDFFVIILSWFLAFYLRFNLDIPYDYFILANKTLLFILPIFIYIFIRNKLYAGVWRYASIYDLKKIILSVLFGTIFLVFILYILFTDPNVPRSVLIIFPILLAGAMSGSRILYRILNELNLHRSTSTKNVILVNSGNDYYAIIKNFINMDNYKILGIFDDDKSIHNREISGIRVIGNVSILEEFVKNNKVDYIFLGSSISNYSTKRNILFLSKKYDFNVLSFPNIEDLIKGNYSFSDIKPIQIEDLLRRKPASINKPILLKSLKSKNIFVSGGGGSIGSEIILNLLKFSPNLIICFDISEFNIYSLKNKIDKAGLGKKTIIHYILGDVKDHHRLKKILTKFKIDEIYHAAAYKHVPLNEEFNIDESLINNVLGTYNLAKISSDLNIKKFIFISTDKSVNPTNVMGASKRLAEIVTQSLQSQSKTKFITVRFGNVLGSSGSVIPLFKNQIENGGPVTVTHPKITRYFMLIEEAAMLVLESSVLGNSGEILHLDMGEPIRILDLAKDMIRLSGFDQNEIKIKFTGLRNGEKIYEELLSDEEKTFETSNDKIRIAKISNDTSVDCNEVLKWIYSLKSKDDKTIKKELKKYVKTFKSYK